MLVSLTMTSSANASLAVATQLACHDGLGLRCVDIVARHGAFGLHAFRDIDHQDAVGAGVAVAHERVDENRIG